MRIKNCVLYHATKYNGRNAGKIRTIKKYYGDVDTERVHYINTDKNKMTDGFYYKTKNGDIWYGNGYFCFWWQMIQLLPSSYNQRRTVMLNYEVLAGIYPKRKDHKLDEWRDFCEWIKSLPYSEIITLYN